MSMMTHAQVVETPVNVTTNSPSQDCARPDDHTSPAYDMSPGFKPFKAIEVSLHSIDSSIAFNFDCESHASILLDITS